MCCVSRLFSALCLCVVSVVCGVWCVVCVVCCVYAVCGVGCVSVWCGVCVLCVVWVVCVLWWCGLCCVCAVLCVCCVLCVVSFMCVVGAWWGEGGEALGLVGRRTAWPDKGLPPIGDRERLVAYVLVPAELPRSTAQPGVPDHGILLAR